jgi:hypothetical protein
MTELPTATQTARTIRLMHASMILGVILFALVTHFVLKPSFGDSGALPVPANILLGASLAACVISILLRRRIPHRSTAESADLYWATAATPALVAWAPLEFAAMIGVFVYSRTGAQPALALAILEILLFVMLSPRYFERR